MMGFLSPKSLGSRDDEFLIALRNRQVFGRPIVSFSDRYCSDFLNDGGCGVDWFSAGDGFGHGCADANAFGDAAVFGIVEAGVGDLEASDGSLDGWDLGEEAGLADGLAVAEASDFGGDDVLGCEFGVDALETREGFGDQVFVWRGELCVRYWHVERHVEDGVVAGFAKVRKLDDAGDVDVGLGDVDPEVRGDGASEFEDDADDADVVDGVVTILPFAGKLGNHGGDVRGWRGTDDGIGGVVAVGGLDAGDAALLDGDLLDWVAEMDSSAEGLNRCDEGVDERDGTTLDVSELFLKDALARAAYATDASPDPGCGDCVGVFVKFVGEERLPEAVVVGGSGPANDPAFGRLVFNGRPVVAAGADEGEEPVAELVDEAYARETKERDGFSPGVEGVAGEEAHGGGPPHQLVADAEFLHQGEGGEIVMTDEVIEAFDGDSVEVEVACHTAGFG